MTSEVDTIYAFIQSVSDERIKLLRSKEILQWLFGDLSFLPSIERKNKTVDTQKYKVLEDTWGRAVLKSLRRSDLTLDKQWTNKFGEHLCEEILMLQGKDVKKPTKKQHYQPDMEAEDAIWEAKAGTFFTTGTAGEKILGCPFKYAEIPDLYEKPLKILCMGGAEKVCREQYGNLEGPQNSPQKKKMLSFFSEMQIEFVAATDMLRQIASL